MNQYLICLNFILVKELLFDNQLNEKIGNQNQTGSTVRGLVDSL